MSYQMSAIPAAHANCMNRVLNQKFNDSGDNLSLRYSANGQEPAEWLVGGWEITDEEKATFPYTKTAPFEIDPEGPAGAFTQQNLDDAVAVLYAVNVDPPEETPLGEMGATAMAMISAQLGVQKINLPD